MFIKISDDGKQECWIDSRKVAVMVLRKRDPMIGWTLGLVSESGAGLAEVSDHNRKVLEDLAEKLRQGAHARMVS